MHQPVLKREPTPSNCLACYFFGIANLRSSKLGSVVANFLQQLRLIVSDRSMFVCVGRRIRTDIVCLMAYLYLSFLAFCSADSMQLFYLIYTNIFTAETKGIEPINQLFVDLLAFETSSSSIRTVSIYCGS